jgi:hypothetical protein
MNMEHIKITVTLMLRTLLLLSAYVAYIVLETQALVAVWHKSTDGWMDGWMDG